MRKHTFILPITAAFIFAASSAQAGIVLGSWNIKHIGWENGKRLEDVARVVGQFDLLAIQEVMDVDVVKQLESILERQTGQPWSSMSSHTVGRGSYQEAYSFVWKDTQVAYGGGAVVYLDPDDRFAREPFVAKFIDRDNGKALALASVHILYGNGRSDRLPEIRELSNIWTWMGEIYPDTPRIIAGDYNLEPSDPAWQPLLDMGAAALITQGATTLSPVNGRYASLYDNLWYEPGRFKVSSAGIIDFPSQLGVSHQKARASISDHAPIYMATGSAIAPTTTAKEGKDEALSSHAVYRATERSSCIDLNMASAELLDQLPQIGPDRAAQIVSGRPWSTVEELSEINGLGYARVSQIAASGQLCPL